MDVGESIPSDLFPLSKAIQCPQGNSSCNISKVSGVVARERSTTQVKVYDEDGGYRTYTEPIISALGKMLNQPKEPKEPKGFWSVGVVIAGTFYLAPVAIVASFVYITLSSRISNARDVSLVVLFILFALGYVLLRKLRDMEIRFDMPSYLKRKAV